MKGRSGSRANGGIFQKLAGGAGEQKLKTVPPLTPPGGRTRDYYRIEDVRGRRYWIFRHGLYEEKALPKWYMHGLLFA
jgi:hypothetical protein